MLCSVNIHSLLATLVVSLLVAALLCLFTAALQASVTSCLVVSPKLCSSQCHHSLVRRADNFQFAHAYNCDTRMNFFAHTFINFTRVFSYFATHAYIQTDKQNNISIIMMMRIIIKMLSVNTVKSLLPCAAWN